MHYASSGLESTVENLLSLGADAAVRDKDGKTDLMLVCKEKKAASAALLAHGFT
jgi:ankyrin repeat protein